MPVHQKKRKYEMGRAPAMTKLGAARVRPVRCRGGNMKYRALRLDAGSYSWGSERKLLLTFSLKVFCHAAQCRFRS